MTQKLIHCLLNWWFAYFALSTWPGGYA